MSPLTQGLNYRSACDHYHCSIIVHSTVAVDKGDTFVCGIKVFVVQKTLFLNPSY